jgi:CDP-L-myo-inositol myo-inositolphosphotransferase
MMGDHIVSETILERLIGRGLAGDACVLAVDCGRSPWVDPTDVTRVRTAGDRIVAIGKGMPDSDIYDTGVFLCSPEVFDAAEQALRSGDGSVSGAVRELAGRDAAVVLDVSGEFWIDVDTARDARHARRLLTAELGKSRDGWVSRVLNRPVSRRALTPLLMRLYPNVTANQVSVLSFLVAASAAAGFTLGQPVVGGLAVHLASVLDGSDGEIARLKRLESPFGSFFDSVLDRYADSLILLGLLFFAWTAPANQDLFGPALDAVVLVVGMLAISGNWLVSYTTARAAADWGIATRGAGSRADRAATCGC